MPGLAAPTAGPTIGAGVSTSPTGQVAIWSSKYETTLAAMQVAQQALDAATGNPKANIAKLREQVAMLNLKLGLYKEFMEFWKEVIKTFLELLKSFGELAQGAR